jgi:hypothetical protein
MAVDMLSRHASLEMKPDHVVRHAEIAALTLAIKGALLISCDISSGFTPTPASAALT